MAEFILRQAINATRRKIKKELNREPTSLDIDINYVGSELYLTAHFPDGKEHNHKQPHESGGGLDAVIMPKVKDLIDYDVVDFLFLNLNYETKEITAKCFYKKDGKKQNREFKITF